MPGGHLPIIGPKKCPREWEPLGSLITVFYGHGVLRSQLLCAYCNRPLWDLETGAPQHIWCKHHMHHQPRGFASFSGAPQHIWCAYDILHQPRGFASCPQMDPAARRFSLSHDNDTPVNTHGSLELDNTSNVDAIHQNIL